MASPVKPSAEAGFTLTEIMVVVFIIGLLSTVAIINVAPAFTQSRETKARADISRIEGALEQYNLALFDYPSQNQGLDSLIEAPQDLRNPVDYPRGGFLRNLPDDPWGRPYQYVFPAQRSRAPYDVFSLGADGQPGGEEQDADIGNWDE